MQYFFWNHVVTLFFSLQFPERANADHHKHHHHHHQHRHQHHHHHHHIVERGDTLGAKNEPIRSSSLIRTLITLLGRRTERRSWGNPTEVFKVTLNFKLSKSKMIKTANEGVCQKRANKELHPAQLVKPC